MLPLLLCNKYNNKVTDSSKQNKNATGKKKSHVKRSVNLNDLNLNLKYNGEFKLDENKMNIAGDKLNLKPTKSNASIVSNKSNVLINFDSNDNRTNSTNNYNLNQHKPLQKFVRIPKQKSRNLVDTSTKSNSRSRSPIESTDLSNYLSMVEFEYKQQQDVQKLSQTNQQTEADRACSISNLQRIGQECQFSRETIHKAINIIDRYISKQISKNIYKTDKTELNILSSIDMFMNYNAQNNTNRFQSFIKNKLNIQHVTAAAVQIASKVEEIYPPEMIEFTKIPEKGMTCEQLASLEIEILNTLDQRTNIPTQCNWFNQQLQDFDQFLNKINLQSYTFLSTTNKAYHRQRILTEHLDALIILPQIIKMNPRTISIGLLFWGLKQCDFFNEILWDNQMNCVRSDRGVFEAENQIQVYEILVKINSQQVENMKSQRRVPKLAALPKIMELFGKQTHNKPFITKTCKLMMNETNNTE